jgi:hypothetical protein
MSVLWAKREDNMRKRNNVKQYTNHLETATALAKHKTEIIRQIDTNCLSLSYMLIQVREILFTLHPDFNLKDLTNTKDEYMPVYKAISSTKNGYHYEVTASVGHDGLTAFSHKAFKHKPYCD